MIDYSRYEKWGFEPKAVDSVVDVVRRMSEITDPTTDLANIQKFLKISGDLQSKIVELLSLSDDLPRYYQSRVMSFSEWLKLGQIKIQSLPTANFHYEKRKLPKKGLHARDVILNYLGSVYEQQTGKPSTVTTDPYSNNQLKGDFPAFLDSILEDAEVTLKAIKRKAKAKRSKAK